MKLISLIESTPTITDEDIVQAMKKIPGYLDITPSDFMEVYLVAFKHAMSRLKNAIKASQIMTKRVISINEDAPVLEAARKMAQNDISGIPILKEDQTVSGVISEKDFLIRMNDEKKPSFMRLILKCMENSGCIATDFKKLKAKDIMSSPPVTINKTTPILDIANTMDKQKINRVPVVDEGLKLVGIIARSDLVKAMG